MPCIVRFRDLEPTWSTRRAREPGFLCWLVTWVGGPPGFINTNRDVAIESTRCAVGLMGLPPGQRQARRHVHGMTEIYVGLQGTLEGFDASGQPHRAGPLDCTSIPAGCPHGVRNCGLDDVLLVWVHDAVEREDVAVGMTVVEPGQRVPAISLPVTRFWLATRGKAIADLPTDATVLGRLDGIQVAAGDAVALRSNRPDNLHLLWVDCPAG